MSLPLTCQICKAGCEVSAESYRFADIFRWWQEQGQRFPDQVLAQYRDAGKTTLITCSKCGFGIFYPPIVGTDQFYQELSNAGRGGYYSRETWEHQQALGDLGECQKILEIGCGAGFFLERLAAQDKDARGIELNAAAAAYARSRGIPVEQAALEEFAGEHRETFDAVCLFQVLEHVAAPLEFLGHALACLKTGGLLIVTVPNMCGILGKMAPLVTNVPPHHVSRWTPDALTSLAEHFQVQVLAIKYEPAYNFLTPYFQERLRHRGVSAYLLSAKPCRFLLSLPIKMLRLLKPDGLDSLKGHTVYAALRKV